MSFNQDKKITNIKSKNEKSKEGEIKQIIKKFDDLIKMVEDKKEVVTSQVDTSFADIINNCEMKLEEIRGFNKDIDEIEQVINQENVEIATVNKRIEFLQKRQKEIAVFEEPEEVGQAEIDVEAVKDALSGMGRPTTASRNAPKVKGMVSLTEYNEAVTLYNKISNEFDLIQEENFKLNDENKKLHTELKVFMNDKIQDTKPKRHMGFVKQKEGRQRGEIFNNEEDGNGIFESENNTSVGNFKIMGQFREKVPHGTCLSVWYKKEGDAIDQLQDGDQRGGSRNGQGMQLYPTGDVQTGEWKNGKKNGMGVLRKITGDMYRGEWTDDIPKGKGIQIFKSGNKFIGEFREGKPDGPGTFVWRDGTRRTGYWKEGILEGWDEVEDN